MGSAHNTDQAALLDACTDYALEHGLPERLGPLAGAADTSSRMLIYHFGTRDGLLREILGQARQRQVEAFTDLLRVRPEQPYRRPEPRMVRDDRTARPPTCACSAACTTPRRTALAGLPAHRDHRLARTPRGRHAQPRPARAGHRRCLPSSAACSWTSTQPVMPNARTGLPRLPLDRSPPPGHSATAGLNL